MISIKSISLWVVVCLFSLYAVPAAAQPTELFISEYIEGSSNNKAIEIYNGTAAPINLGANGYNIQMFFNGNPTPTLTINLVGTVAPGDVFVLAQASASADILAQADQTNGSGWFNGDDAVVLRRGTTIIDSIGQAGFDPGTEWGTGLVSTADNTLRRKAAVLAGDGNSTNVFDPSIEWDGFPTDTFNGLGAHLNEPVNIACGGALPVPVGRIGSRIVTATDADGVVTSLTLVSVTPIPAGGAITVSGVTPASSPGGVASATVNISAAVPLGSYVVRIRATNSDTNPQTASCTFTVNVLNVPTFEIWAIQGSGAASPQDGNVIFTENNIVTARAANGFFIQTPAARADASDQTSNGIFVFTGAAPAVNVGDQVDVVATVDEFFDMTELVGPNVSVDSQNNALPAAVVFEQIAPGVFVPSHDPVPNELERFEGMRVRVVNGRVGGPTDRFGDVAIVADSTRPFREPGIEFPGVVGYPVTWDGNPEIIEIDPDGAGLPFVAMTAGTVIELAEGPLSFAFGDYQIWPTTLTIGDAPELPTPVRLRNPGELTVGSQNLLRLFDTVNDDGVDDDVATPQEYQDRLTKASLHIRTVLRSPDVLVLEEVENIGVANALAAQIASDEPDVFYTAYLVEGHDIGGIDIAVLVRNTVSNVAISQLNPTATFTFNGVTSFLHDRPPLVLQGDYVGNGAPFPITVIGIHNRSLNDIDDPVAGPRVRQKRLEQALNIANAIQSFQVAQPDRRMILIGDFNAFQFSDGYVDSLGVITGNLDPNGAIQPGHVDVVDPNLTNQVAALPAAQRYSYVFEGSAQVLDHALTTGNLAPFLRGLQYSRGNADAPALQSLRSDPTTPLATSDHDAPVLFVMTDNDADGLPDDVDNCATNPNPNQSDFDSDGTGDVCDADDDNDGVLDAADACQLSAPLGAFVVVDACTTAVPEQMLINGCSISESIASIGERSWTHGQFVSGVTLFGTQLTKDTLIDNKQRSEILRCAAWANVP